MKWKSNILCRQDAQTYRLDNTQLLFQANNSSHNLHRKIDRCCRWSKGLVPQQGSDKHSCSNYSGLHSIHAMNQKDSLDIYLSSLVVCHHFYNPHHHQDRDTTSVLLVIAFCTSGGPIQSELDSTLLQFQTDMMRVNSSCRVLLAHH